MRAIHPTESERQTITEAGITDPLMQSYAAFRHSVLWMAAPLTVLSALLALIALRDLDTELFNSFGVLAQLAPTIGVWILTAATLLALASWSRPAASARILMIGWAVSIALPLLVALCPIDWLLDGAVKSQGAEQLPLIRVAYGVGYAINLLPTVLSFPSGIIRGATRIKSMLPTSTVSGWSLMVLAPMYAMFFIVAMVLIGQIAGTPLLLIGTVLIAASPVVHMRANDLYVRALTDPEQVSRLGAVQKRAAIISILGSAAIVVWAFTAEFAGNRIIGTGDNDLLDPLTGALRLLELLARLLITTAVFSHVILQMTEAHWRHERGFHTSRESVTYEQQMVAIERTLRTTGEQLN